MTGLLAAFSRPNSGRGTDTTLRHANANEPSPAPSKPPREGSAIKRFVDRMLSRKPPSPKDEMITVRYETTTTVSRPLNLMPPKQVTSSAMTKERDPEWVELEKRFAHWSLDDKASINDNGTALDQIDAGNVLHVIAGNASKKDLSTSQALVSHDKQVRLSGQRTVTALKNVEVGYVARAMTAVKGNTEEL